MVFCLVLLLQSLLQFQNFTETNSSGRSLTPGYVHECIRDVNYILVIPITTSCHSFCLELYI